MSGAQPVALEQAFSALRQGKVEEARRLFESLTQRTPAAAAAWLGLAYSCADLGDETTANRAVSQALALEPRNLRALLFKADQRVRSGEPRQSLALYGQALRVASAGVGPLSPDVQQGLKRAQAVTERYAAEYGDFLMNALQARGYREAEASPRFRQSLEISLGRKQVHYQEPTRFYFPGLPQRQFYERGEFPWLADLEAGTDRIRDELLSVMAERDRFTPYLQSSQDFPDGDPSAAKIRNNPDWGALYLWEYGCLVQENAVRLPQAVRALEVAPLPHVHGQLPIVLYSRLAAHTHIPPHHGMLNTRLICHLPLIVPKNCGTLRCGNEHRAWVEGETLIFDDSIEHEAWNKSDQERIVLLFDIWRPELTAEERDLVAGVLEIVKEYNEQQD